jgi:hypothetical protein
MLLSLGAAASDLTAKQNDVPSAEAIFGRAKGVWRGREEAPYVRYNLLERYTWRKHVHENWWRGAYRERDRALSLQRVIEPGEEAARLRGMSIGINLNVHHGGMHTDSVDTNADADAFPILDPLIDPNASFGLARSDAEPSLSGAKPYGVALSATVAPAPLPTPSEAPDGALLAAAPDPSETPLRELARVEAVTRDYTIALAGMERVHDQDAYHLTLVPLRQPRTYRLRDLWVATKTYETLRLDVDGLFGGRPYEDARWSVTFVDFNGLAYVQQIRAEATLRFGLDRYVDDLEYDFVEYAFPQTMSPLEFERLR